jgi:hypothetical protein
MSNTDNYLKRIKEILKICEKDLGISEKELFQVLLLGFHLLLIFSLVVTWK